VSNGLLGRLLYVCALAAHAGCYAEIEPPTEEEEAVEDPDSAWAIKPLTLTPDSVTARVGERVWVRISRTTTIPPTVTHTIEFARHELQRCGVNYLSTCRTMRLTGYEIVSDSIADLIAVDLGCKPRPGGGAVNLSSCFSLRVYERGNGPGLDYGTGAGWEVVSCGRTWISYRAKRAVGENDSVVYPPFLAALTDTTRINVRC